MLDSKFQAGQSYMTDLQDDKHDGVDGGISMNAEALDQDVCLNRVYR